jgi:RNA polymerase sigma-70 factor, ECF subfamily
VDRVQDVVVTAPVGFDECFREHYSRLVALGASMSGSVEVGRDLAQETLLRASQRWDEVAGLEQPGAWLRRVMVNLLIDHHRSGSAERAALKRLNARAREVRVADPADVDDAAWCALLAALPARRRLIVELYYGDDRSIAEIAALVGISVGAVKSALGKARARLNRVLEDER